MGRVSDARERLLASARELIHERGYNAVGVSELCQHAGINKGSFYHFFPSKQSLALDVVDSVWLESRSFLEETLLGDAPPLERLRNYFDALYEGHRQRCGGRTQNGCPLGNLALEMSTQDALLRDRLLQSFEGHIGYFERLLREAQSRGDVVEDLDPRRTSEALVAFIQGQIMLSKLRDEPEVLRDLAPLALRLVGVRNENTEPTPQAL